MNTEHQITALLQDLIRKTSEGSLRWSIEAPPHSFAGTNNIHPIFARTQYKQKDLVIFERRYKHFLDEDEYFWDASVVIGILGPNDALIWEYSDASFHLHELFRAVREQASGINDLLANL